MTGFITRTLAFWLGVSAVATLWFLWLLIHLPNFCPLCPWKHFLNYVAFGAAFWLKTKEPRPSIHPRAAKLGLLVAGCVGFFILIQSSWAIAFLKGYVR